MKYIHEVHVSKLFGQEFPPCVTSKVMYSPQLSTCATFLAAQRVGHSPRKFLDPPKVIRDDDDTGKRDGSHHMDGWLAIIGHGHIAVCVAGRREREHTEGQRNIAPSKIPTRHKK